MQTWRVFFLSLLPMTLAMRHEGRIVGGDKVTLGEYPFVVALGYVNPVTGTGELCTGSLLNAEWVLTAGHCVEVKSVRDYTVVAGVTDIKQPTGQRRRAKTLVAPSKYYHQKESNMFEVIHDDIALLQVDWPFILNNFVQPIALSGAPPPYTGQFCEAVGFGKTSVPDELMTELSKAVASDLNIQAGILLRIKNAPPVPCSWVQEASGHEAYQICSWAGRLNVSHVNSGDSGGPLVCNGVQVGVCSLSDFIKDDDKFYVLQTHTSVSYFKEWIRHFVPNAIFLDYQH